ncbi:luciferin sulfotransferase-like isoform X2 [Diabrotica virgifera virgifera]|nr:luciferin sulfotransferase-like isoform X2 [Diabrotica virgifera virgifera]XP_050517029.1 luciferin sulfotransferase-like isoform X2 [Diabrotica virgifera virgifera]
MPTVKRDYSNEELEKWLDRDFTSVFRSGYVNVKGVTMPRRFEELQSDIFNWNVSERDVWICSFPKTGTTWTQEMVWMIMNNLDIIKGQENLGIRSPFLEVTALFDYRKFQKENTDFQPPPFIEDSLKFVREKSQKGSLCLKTHLPWVLLPQEIQNNTKQPKIIYVTRNPKDTCISYYNHSRLMEGYRGSFEEFCQLFLSGKLTFAPYWNHVLPFWEKRNQPNILFLKYEKMIQDLPSIIKEVADFLETPLTPEQITTLSDHLSFESMKKNPAVNYEMIVSLNRKFKLIECDGTFMRSGKVGDYKAKMSPEIIQAFDEWTAENVQGTDFSF